MRQSQLFSKTRKVGPKDEVSKNAELLVRAGFVNKEMAGVYSYLPLGIRVLKNIESIIRKEMNELGGVEVLLSSLHPKENWLKTGRFDGRDDIYKVTDTSGREVVLGATHEEIITPLMKQFVSSYKDLPVAPYQFQTKFRMELRSKSGILRGREFIMKDLYSFHKDTLDLEQFYGKVKEAYEHIFNAVGIGEKTYFTFASGGTFSKYSHEFQTITDAGEDTIYVDEKKKLAVNKEICTDEVLQNLELDKKDLVEKKAIEVGNIFKLGTRFSDAFEFTYQNEKGESMPIYMGCYGIGLGRLMGTIVEILSDEKGLVWPENVAPFHAHLLFLGEKGSEVEKEASLLYRELTERNVLVLFDDRDARAGEKFADCDLIGIPWRVVVSTQTHKEKKIELKRRGEEKSSLVSKETLFKEILSPHD